MRGEGTGMETVHSSQLHDALNSPHAHVSDELGVSARQC